MISIKELEAINKRRAKQLKADQDYEDRYQAKLESTDFNLLTSTEKIIITGRTLLEKGIFPNKIIEKISNINSKQYIASQILDANKNRNIKSLPLKAKLFLVDLRHLFSNHLSASTQFKSIGYYFISICLLLLFPVFFSNGELDKNYTFAFFSLFNALPLLIISQNSDLYSQFKLPLVIFYIAFFSFEFFVFGIPDTFFTKEEVLLFPLSKHERGARFVIRSLPKMYIFVRLLFGVLISKVYVVQLMFFYKKRKFEKEMSYLLATEKLK